MGRCKRSPHHLQRTPAQTQSTPPRRSPFCHSPQTSQRVSLYRSMACCLYRLFLYQCRHEMPARAAANNSQVGTESEWDGITRPKSHNSPSRMTHSFLEVHQKRADKKQKPPYTRRLETAPILFFRAHP